eukprot:10249119-Alexandrium_andersonii.AAC.1
MPAKDGSGALGSQGPQGRARYPEGYKRLRKEPERSREPHRDSPRMREAVHACQLRVRSLRATAAGQANKGRLGRAWGIS